MPEANDNGDSLSVPSVYRAKEGPGYGYGRPTQPGHDVDAVRYWRVFKRHFRIILASTFGVAALVAVLTLRMPRVFAASATLLVSLADTQMRSPLAELPGSDDATAMNTDIALMNTPGVLQYALGTVRRRIPGITVEALAGAVTAAPVRGTNLVTVTAEWGNPKECALIANAVAEAFTRYELVQARESDLSTVSSLTSQLSDSKRELGDAELSMERFEEAHGLAGAPTEQASGGSPGSGDEIDAGAVDSNAQTELQSAEGSLTAALEQQAVGRRQIQDAKTKLAEYDRQLSLQSSGAIRDNTLVKSLRQDLETKKAQLADLNSSYTAAGVKRYYPGLLHDIARLKRQLKTQLGNLSNGNAVDLDLQQQLNTQLYQAQVDQDTEATQIRMLRQQITHLRARVLQQPSLSTQFERLVRQRNVLHEIYRMLLEKQKQVEISVAAVQGDARVVADSVAPNTPIRPDRKANLAIGVVLGLMIGICIASLLEALDNKVRTWIDVQDTLGLPVLAAIPVGDAIPEHVWESDHRSVLAEAYRMLRSSLSFVRIEAPVKSILVTSARPAEGKSTTVANLACAYAHDGKRVVVVDADLRKPGITRLLGGTRKKGLAGVLSGAVGFHEAVQPSIVPGVALIPVGQSPPNPAELLGSPRMAELLALLREEFDIILIDSSPCLMVVDPLILASKVDAVIQVVAAGRTTRAAAARARAMLENAHGRVVGAVLNVVKASDEGGYEYYYYSYYYGSDDSASTRPRRRRLSGGGATAGKEES